MSSPYFFKNGDRHFVVDKLREFLYSRWYLTTVPKHKVCSAVFDSSLTTMITEYQRYHRLRPNNSTVNLNTLLSANSILNESTYEQIGSEMTAAAIDAMSVHDVEVKKLFTAFPPWISATPGTPSQQGS